MLVINRKHKGSGLNQLLQSLFHYINCTMAMVKDNLLYRYYFSNSYWYLNHRTADPHQAKEDPEWLVDLIRYSSGCLRLSHYYPDSVLYLPVFLPGGTPAITDNTIVLKTTIPVKLFPVTVLLSTTD